MTYPSDIPETPKQGDHARDVHGRGAVASPRNRFESLEVVDALDDPLGEFGELYVEESAQDGTTRRDTLYLKDASKTILSRNESPDIGFSLSLNPYRGCEHGCSYCYARPTHEYLGYSAGLDFETRILVKHSAPKLLEAELSRRGFEPQTLGLSGVTDAYQPVEKRFEITRKCLEILVDCRLPVAIVTKNHLVTRDLDLLEELNRYHAVSVFLSITTLDSDLARTLEPRASSPKRRLDALEALSSQGIPCGVLVAPVIPALTDHEIPAILEAAASAGAQRASRVLLRLPHNLKQQFELWLRAHFPDRADRVLSHLQASRGGQLNDSRFGSRMTGTGPLAKNLAALFEASCHRYGLNSQTSLERCRLSSDHFRPPSGDQLGLFRD